MLQARSICDASRILRQRINQVRSVSFDVFDTLFARRIHPPELVHERVAQQLAMWIGHPSWQFVLQERYEAERLLRETAGREGLDRECDLESILSHWIGSLGTNDTDLIEKILQYELQLEKDALFLQEGARDLLSWLYQQDVKLYALSDVYLNSKYLQQLFDHFDINRFFARIYSSADSRLCKYSSRLFEYLKKEHQIHPQNHLHIGDNQVSDFSSPRKLGMQAIYLHDPKSILRRARLQRHKSLSERKPLFSGRYFYQVLTNGPVPEFSNFYERYGYEVLSPIFALFGLGLMERLKRHDYDAVYFLSRDGHLLQEIAARLLNAGWTDSSLPRKLKYVHVSRKASFAAMAADGLSVQQARVGLYSPTQRGLESILQTFSLPVSLFQEIAHTHGFQKIDQPIYDFFDRRLDSFFADPGVQEIIKTENGKCKTYFLEYLRQEGLFDIRRAALVDIGWNGTIQYSLHKLTENSSPRPVVDGYYLAYSSGIGYPMPDNWTAEGIIYDELRKHPGERTALHFEEIFEESARSLEGSTIGYDRCPRTGLIYPVFKPEDSADRMEERKRDQEILDLQRGILAGLESFIQALRLTGLGFQDLKAFFLYHLERALVYPSLDEVFHLSRLTHANDFGFNTTMDLESIRTRRHPVFQYRQLIREVYTSEWVYGKVTGLWFNLPRYLMRIRELSRLNGHA